ncbi:MarR family transcriptional regulator [Tsukamurella sp. 8F]|uniref:MarR family winged helix-turn-helix transcriptional regulator n=1 Tax=unclassified Tsukamurella TaxID=2633480 RepID=UPI0023BA3B47|nr:MULTISPECIES: MarR family transcriptional regulator [unclassified Tsukamurella]MDF0529558.1 MarR family transcriptional regulator [Tsukamurella sp. 8J]MDF0585754.1 MarR family transcriptional regulator [Tsukamurella sp. 8F]
MPDDTPDEVWALLTHAVMERRGAFRRAAAERAGLPFSRVRVLKRLRRGPMTIGRIAESADMDAPAATVAVNDLVERGLVDRTPDPHDRRARLVSLTAAGRATVADAVSPPGIAPPELEALTTDELRVLADIARRLQVP